MAKSAGAGGGEPHTPERLPQHPYVERLKPEPSEPARRVVHLTGLPGNSDRAGYQRLYLTTKLDYYAEFRIADIAHAEVVSADRSPFLGHEATRVSVGRDATIDYIRRVSAGTVPGGSGNNASLQCMLAQMAWAHWIFQTGYPRQLYRC